MDKKITSIVAYVGMLIPKFGAIGGLIVWLIAYFLGDKKGAKCHLNQSLVLVVLNVVLGVILWVLGLIPIIDVIAGILGWVIYVVMVLLSILGIVYAVKGEDKELPFIGGIKIL